MDRTMLALNPAPMAGFARPCAIRHGYVWLRSVGLGDTSFGATTTNSKRSTRWSRRRPT